MATQLIKKGKTTILGKSQGVFGEHFGFFLIEKIMFDLNFNFKIGNISKKLSDEKTHRSSFMGKILRKLLLTPLFDFIYNKISIWQS